MEKLTQRQKQAIETKMNILKVSLELFKEHSFDAVKIQDICDKASISVGAFYHHFGSKKAIINIGYKQVDRLLKERYEKEVFLSNKDKILGLLGEGGVLLEELGWQLVAEIYKHLLSVNDKYAFSEDRYVYLEILAAVKAALENNEIKEDYEAVELTNLIMRLSRGAIFDWCLSEGACHLKDHITQDLRLVLK